MLVSVVHYRQAIGDVEARLMFSIQFCQCKAYVPVVLTGNMGLSTMLNGPGMTLSVGH